MSNFIFIFDCEITKMRENSIKKPIINSAILKVNIYTPEKDLPKIINSEIKIK